MQNYFKNLAVDSDQESDDDEQEEEGVAGGEVKENDDWGNWDEAPPQPDTGETMPATLEESSSEVIMKGKEIGNGMIDTPVQNEKTKEKKKKKAVQKSKAVEEPQNQPDLIDWDGEDGWSSWGDSNSSPSLSGKKAD